MATRGNPAGLPDGTYSVKLVKKGQRLASAKVTLHTDSGC
jgi:hypothetical protein